MTTYELGVAVLVGLLTGLLVGAALLAAEERWRGPERDRWRRPTGFSDAFGSVWRYQHETRPIERVQVQTIGKDGKWRSWMHYLVDGQRYETFEAAKEAAKGGADDE